MMFEEEQERVGGRRLRWSSGWSSHGEHTPGGSVLASSTGLGCMATAVPRRSGSHLF
jgi:hypothetical protein